MGTVSVKTFVAPKSLAMTYGTSRAQGAITFSWDTASWTGEYLDGPVWVYVPSGTISMSEPTPAQTTVSTKIVNGAEKNPTNTAGTQGFDENGASWDVSRLASFPATLTAGDVIVKAKYKAGWALARDGVVEQYASCFIVDSIPAVNSFSPAAISWTGRTTKDASVVDVGAWVDANCPSYDTSGHAQVPSYTNLMANLDVYNPVASMGDTDSSFYQDMSPYDSSGNPSNYGEYLGGIFSGAGLALCSSSFSRLQKINIATRLISHGKQWYDSMINGTAFNENGGHFQWHLVPMAVYLHATGQTAALSTLFTDIPGNYGQALQFTAAQIATLTPHSSMTAPFTWRRRNVTNVSGTTITVEFTRSGTTGDPSQVDFSASTMKLVRESDGAEANITELSFSPTANATSTDTLTIDAQPSPVFAISDVVYFKPIVMPTVGEYDWAINGVGQFNNYNPSPGASYRNLNVWSGQVLSTKALGCFPADGDAVQGYVERANAANTPSASFDFPTHHNSMYLTAGTKNWEAEFWADHAATILA